MNIIKHDVVLFHDIDSETPYKKKSKRKTPKKADHKHDYEPVLISFRDSRFHPNPESPTGYDDIADYVPWSRCRICSRLELEFPENSGYHGDCFMLAKDLLKKYPELDVVEVNDIWNLNA